jgi:hypothetical protein
MFCSSCGSTNIDTFSAETGIRHSGLKNIDKQAVFVFSQLIVCLDCGRAEFVVPQLNCSGFQSATSLDCSVRCLMHSVQFSR